VLESQPPTELRACATPDTRVPPVVLVMQVSTSYYLALLNARIVPLVSTLQLSAQQATHALTVPQANFL